MKIEGSCHCGKVRWIYDAPLESVTACNCTACRRFGALWAYGYVDHEIKTSGDTQAYARGKALEFHFCANCGCTAFWRGLSVDEKGRRRIAVNVRLCENPDAVAPLKIDHFDGLNTFEDLPHDGRCVKDMWF